jgi:hypothetical protein
MDGAITDRQGEIWMDGAIIDRQGEIWMDGWTDRWIDR